MSRGRILVVDDERSIREFLSILLEQEGYTIETADGVASGVDKLATCSFDVVICDLKLPDGSGLQVLEEAKKRQLPARFIIITAHTTPQHAIDSLRAGAAEYLSKPFDVEDLKFVVAKQIRNLEETERGSNLTQFIGSSSAMRKILDLVPRVASTPSTVLVTGESGTGKELLAKAIHEHSERAAGPFITVNCGALPEGLLESELFGHVRGSFTGAVRDHMGLMAQANGGTIFLDEIGELSPVTQVKLLRVLQEHRVRPVGGTQERVVDVRVIAATNRDLAAEAANGIFREDLFYRLNVIHLHLPPLRQRKDDIPDLARHFVERVCHGLQVKEKRLTSDAISVLQAYDWPGNVRELENIMERTVTLEPSEIITSGSLPDTLRGRPHSPGLDAIALPEEGVDLEEYLTGLRRSLIRQALERSGGQQKRAARLLRMTYRSFRYHAGKLGLIREEEDNA